MSGSADVVIVGAGVIGSAIALELTRLGYKTLNVDKLPAAGYGPTSNSCSIVRAHYSTPDGVALAWDNFSYWQNWQDYLEVNDERGFARFVQCGTVLLKAADSTNGSLSHWQKVKRCYDEQKVQYEEWDLDELEARVPYLNASSYWPPARPETPEFWNEPAENLPGAIYTASSGYVNDPQLATHNLQVAAEAGGARFTFNDEVTAVLTTGGRVSGVALRKAGTLAAKVVVNVAGPWSFVVNRMAGVEDDMKIKTRALRHEVHHVPAPEGINLATDGHHISDGDQAIYFRPEVGNTFLVGSEDPPCDPQVWVEDPDTYNRVLTDAQWRAQVYRLARRVPGIGIPHVKRGVVDLYDVSDDWVPLYDKSCLPGFYMAIGTSGNQFKNAAGVGYLMARLIDSCENGQDHDLEPVRVRTRFTGAELDLGFYSRLREPNPESSRSVNG